MPGFGPLIAAIPTPLDAERRIAVPALGNFARALLNSGANSLVLFGTTGEGTFFSVSEKVDAAKALIATGIEARNIILATGACALTDAARIVDAVADLGCAAALVLPPFFTKGVDDDGLADWMAALIAVTSGDAKILLYHIPAVAGVGYSPALARNLLDKYPARIVGVKDSSPDAALALPLAADRRPGIYVSNEVGLAQNLTRGIAGSISASLNLTLPLVRTALAKPDANLERSIAALRAHLATPTLICGVKTAVADETGDATWKRLAPPHRPPPNFEEAAFLKRYRALKAGET